MEWLFSAEALMALASLAVLEIILGIDNIIFISVFASRLPKAQQLPARIIGLGIALAFRILFLFLITLIMKLSTPLFSVFELSFTGKDLILLIGGLFLLAKATMEIHHALEGETETEIKVTQVSFVSIVAQIILIDVVFSIDSVITAIGMAKSLPIMVTAMIIAIIVMLLAANAISSVIENNPTLKMLALSFLVLIGTALVADGLGLHIPKAYLYFAIAFSISVELLNIKVRKSGHPVVLAKGKSIG